MKINRKELLDKLFGFTQADSGVLIGSPGIGKSYLLSELSDLCLKQDIPAVIIRIDQLIEGSDIEIKNTLNLPSEKWTDILRNIIPSSFQKAILVFDAYDSTRDEELRKKILQQISNAQEKLKENWNIIVSVRTYDATKSPELIRLFPNTIGGSQLIKSRQFEIPYLTNNELNPVLESSPKMSIIYNEGSNKLREILHIPYYLRLLEKIIDTATKEEIAIIKKIKSETQLLINFWSIKIRNQQGSLVIESTLLKITKKLVDKKVLTIAKTNLVNEISSDNLSLEYLIKEDILSELSVNKSRIGYSHNILFDFAVSQLVFSDNLNDIILFIKEDLSRPFFLRPSFIYFFTQLWYYERHKFWEIYWGLYKESQREIQLLVLVSLNAVIASEFDDFEDFEPVLARSDSKETIDVIRRILQSLRFIKTKLSFNDLNLLLNISKRLDFNYLWEFSFLLERAVAQNLEDETVLQFCGEIVRRFFGYMLEKRTDKDLPANNNLERLSSMSGVPLIAKTYKTDIESNKRLLKKVLLFLNEPNFEIWYFSALSDSLQYILPYDPSFVAEVYLSIFQHKETSEAQTRMGVSMPLNLLSNRRQDFDMCYYRLTEFFPNFITSVPEIAIPAGLSIVNKYVLENRRQYVSKPQVYELNINGLKCRLIPDWSSSWGDNLSYDQPAQLTLKIIEYFESLAYNNEFSKIVGLVYLYFKNASVGLTWKKIIEFATKFPDKLIDVFFELCTSAIILKNADTTYEIGRLIEVAFPYYDLMRRGKIELAILNVNENKGSDDYTVVKLLNVIPNELLQLEESRQLVQNNPPYKNEPEFKITSSISDYTKEDWFRDEGVNISEPIVLESIEITRKLDEFNNKWLNGNPHFEECESIIEIANKLFLLTKTNQFIDSKVAFTNYNGIAKAVSIISRNQKIIEQNGYFNLIKDIILFCFAYYSDYDKNFDENSSVSRGYSSTPRIDATEGLINCACVDEGDDVIDIIKFAASDKNPIVRFIVIRFIGKLKSKYPEAYLTIIMNCLRNERDTFTVAVAFNEATRYPDEANVLNESLSIVTNRPELIEFSNQFTEVYAHVLLELFGEKNDEQAKEALFKSAENVVFCSGVIFQLFKIVDPGVNQNKYSSRPDLHRPLFEFLLSVIGKAGAQLITLEKGEGIKEGSKTKEVFQLINYLVERIYFSLSLKNIGNNKKLPVEKSDREAYFKILQHHLHAIIDISSKIQGNGLIIGPTAYHFMQILNSVVDLDPRDILRMAAEVTKYAMQSGFTFDLSSIREVTQLTEKLLADHRDILTEQESFNNLIELLDLYVKSGWIEALEILWRLDEVFK